MKNKKGIIILGGHVQALGIVRIYGKMGIPAFVIDNTTNNIARHSRYCKGFYKCADQNLLNFLLDNGKTESYRNYIVLPTNDKHVELLSRNKQELSKYFIVGTDDWGAVEKCYNKRLTYQIAKKIGIPIAQTLMPNSWQELSNQSVQYPCVLKPAVMHNFYNHFKRKVFICNNKSELQINYEKALTFIPKEEIIVQAVIPGGSEHLYSGCFLFDGYKPVNYFAGRRARQHPPDFGNATTFAQIVDNEEIVSLSIRLLKHIGYKGVCEVEFKYDEGDKTYKLLEINPRTWKWHSIAEMAEVNMLENYYYLLNNLPVKAQETIKKTTFRHLVTDIPMWFKYKMQGIYKKHPTYSVKYAVWVKKDLKPAIFELIYLPIFMWKR